MAIKSRATIDAVARGNDGTRGRKGERKSGNGASLGFEAELFKAADKLRGNMEPSECRARSHLPEIHLGCVRCEARDAARRSPPEAEDREEYLAENIFWVPKEAR